MLSLTVFPDDTKQKIAIFFPPKIAYMFSKLLWTTIRSLFTQVRRKIKNTVVCCERARPLLAGVVRYARFFAMKNYSSSATLKRYVN